MWVWGDGGKDLALRTAWATSFVTELQEAHREEARDKKPANRSVVPPGLRVGHQAPRTQRARHLAAQESAAIATKKTSQSRDQRKCRGAVGAPDDGHNIRGSQAALKLHPAALQGKSERRKVMLLPIKGAFSLVFWPLNRPSPQSRHPLRESKTRGRGHKDRCGDEDRAAWRHGNCCARQIVVL